MSALLASLLFNKLVTGPCQFPTLGFVVSRYNQVKSFVAETFWYIYLALSREDPSIGKSEETPFTWRRGHLFDMLVSIAIFEHVLASPIARVSKVTNKNTKKWFASSAISSRIWRLTIGAGNRSPLLRSTCRKQLHVYSESPLRKLWMYVLMHNCLRYTHQLSYRLRKSSTSKVFSHTPVRKQTSLIPSLTS